MRRARTRAEDDARLVELRPVGLVQPTVVATAAAHVEGVADGVDRAVGEEHARGGERDRGIVVERADERLEPPRLGERVGVEERDQRRRRRRDAGVDGGREAPVLGERQPLDSGMPRRPRRASRRSSRHPPPGRARAAASAPRPPSRHASSRRSPWKFGMTTSTGVTLGGYATVMELDAAGVALDSRAPSGCARRQMICAWKATMTAIMSMISPKPPSSLTPQK